MHEISSPQITLFRGFSRSRQL